MLVPKYRVPLTESEKAELEQLVRRHSTAQNVVKRARIILLAKAEKGKATRKLPDKSGGKQVRCDAGQTKRWMERATEPVEERLGDAPRCGRPDRITAEQWCRILALACEPPEDHGLPITCLGRIKNWRKQS
jgi:putative transposase